LMFKKLKQLTRHYSTIREHAEAHALRPAFVNPRVLNSRHSLAVPMLVVRGILVICTPQSW
jgi:hypothetical protein